jgi:hypothetical protein
MPVIHTEVDPNTGTVTRVHKNDDKWTFEKKFDAEPFKDMAAEARAQTDGERWGEHRHVGYIPAAVLGTMMRQDGGLDRDRLLAWLKANPALVTFSKFLK